MKLQFKKTAAVAMAMTMCVSGVAMAADPTPTPAPINGEAAGSFNTSFDIYSPSLHISVPLKADIEINPMADPNDTAKTVKQFTVASNSIDIINASVDKDTKTGIPVNVTVKASITRTSDDVMTEYNSFTENKQSTKKRVNLNLREASDVAVLDDTNEAPMSGTEKAHLLDLSKYTIATKAKYDTTASTTNMVPITKYGSLLSVDIDAPAIATTWTDATSATPVVGSFAVTGVANPNADWKE